MNVIILKLKFGELQTFKNMSILSLFMAIKPSPEYLLLEEALDKDLITISEVDPMGTVPELKAINTSPHSILMLEGEELIGAKQNRVLNTSILLKSNSEVIIPVSCTEQGRWEYTSATFSHSDIIMSHGARARKVWGVTDSLHGERGYSSDQARVWADINRLDRETGTLSSTGALRDVYATKTDELNEYLQAIECVPHQQGSLVFINGEAVGFDIVSQEAAYKTLHPKLIKSYAMDALLRRKDNFDKPSKDKARALLQEAQGCEKSKFDSINQGYDYRLQGSNVVGSALVFEDTIIHFVFFKLPKSERTYQTAGYVWRRRL